MGLIVTDDKPGTALEDRIRERTRTARTEYQAAVRKVFPDFEEPTLPQNNIPYKGKSNTSDKSRQKKLLKIVAVTLLFLVACLMAGFSTL